MRVALALLLATAVASAQTPVETAARERQDKLRSVEFRFRQKTVQESSAEPRDETAAYRLTFDGDKAVLEIIRDDPTPGTVRRWRAATDGERVTVSLTVEKERNIDPEQSSGEIGSATDGVCRDLRCVALTLAARGLDPIHCHIPADTFTPTGTTSEVRGGCATSTPAS